MAKKIGVAVVGLLALLLVVIGLQPSTFRVARTAEIHAPPAVVFNILNDLHQGARWSPFEKLDPNMKKTFSGPESGPGASYTWDGNDQAGSGTMTIENVEPNELIEMKLDFTRPMVCSNEVKYTLVPTEKGTEVSWIMEGKNNFIGKAFCMFMDMEGMVGKDFQQGLTNLDTVAQEDARKLETTTPELKPEAVKIPEGETTPATP